MSLLLAALLATHLAGTAVPGQCTAPASEHVGEPGCYLSAEADIKAANGQIYWHIYSLPTLIDARVAATMPARRWPSKRMEKRGFTSSAMRWHHGSKARPLGIP
jgi:hypothetical protein